MGAGLNVYGVLGLQEGNAHVIRNVGGMITDGELKARIQEDVGLKPHFALEAFTDLEGDVRQSIARLRNSPFVPNKDSVRGFVYELETGRLRKMN